MAYSLLADLVVLVHLAFVAFVVAGGLLAMRWRWVVWAHLPAVAWGAAIEFLGWVCPLTPLENHLREAGGAAGYPGGFIEHYVVPVLYPAGLTPTIQVTLGFGVLVLNGIVYGYILRSGRKDRTRRAGASIPRS